MEAVDAINARWGRGTAAFAVPRARGATGGCSRRFMSAPLYDLLAGTADGKA